MSHFDKEFKKIKKQQAKSKRWLEQFTVGMLVPTVIVKAKTKKP